MTSDAFLAFLSDKWKLAFTKIQQKPTFPNIHGSFVHSGQKQGPPGVPGGGRWADRGPCRCRAPLGIGEGHVASRAALRGPMRKPCSRGRRSEPRPAQSAAQAGDRAGDAGDQPPGTSHRGPATGDQLQGAGRPEMLAVFSHLNPLPGGGTGPAQGSRGCVCTGHFGGSGAREVRGTWFCWWHGFSGQPCTLLLGAWGPAVSPGGCGPSLSTGQVVPSPGPRRHRPRPGAPPPSGAVPQHGGGSPAVEPGLRSAPEGAPGPAPHRGCGPAGPHDDPARPSPRASRSGSGGRDALRPEAAGTGWLSEGRAVGHRDMGTVSPTGSGRGSHLEVTEDSPQTAVPAPRRTRPSVRSSHWEWGGGADAP